MKKHIVILFALGFPVFAQAAGEQGSKNSSLVIGGGLGVASVPHYPGSDENEDYLLPIPYVNYTSDRLSVDDEGLHAALLETDVLSLDFDVMGSLPVSSDDNEARQGMPDLGFFLEAGPEVSLRLLRKENYLLSIDVPLRASLELLGETDALKEKFLQDAGYLLEPRLHFEFGRNNLSLDMDAGFIWASDGYQARLFSVGRDFVTADRPFFEARSGLLGHRLSSSLKYETEEWLALGYVKFIGLDEGKNDMSPLMRETDYFLAGLGLIRKFVIW